MIHAKDALLAEGWASDVRVSIEDGAIARIETGAAPQAGDARTDVLLPALANLHSHAFQRAMAGMTEYAQAGRDSFWTWRELMYRFTARLSPDDIEAIAAQVYVEMLEAGYASVGEFHYLHHAPGGAEYDDIAELSKRIFAAAGETGIGLTHLPVLYSYGGAGEAELEAGQARFGNDLARYQRLVEAARKGLGNLPRDARLGLAPHSLRATSPADLAALLNWREAGPIHIHIAEQQKEVRDIEAWLGARPVDWLLQNADVTGDWCFIHATHMTPEETAGMAASGAVAGLCPITEANLGDGAFDGPRFLAARGAFGVGSDSNVNISLTEELRTLEYSQRLRDESRNVMVAGAGSVGRFLYSSAAQGGAQALGRSAGQIAEGQLADLTAIDRSAPSLCALTRDQLLDGLCFAAKDDVITDVWAAGRHMVRAGRHVAREAVFSRYRAAMARLLAA